MVQQDQAVAYNPSASFTEGSVNQSGYRSYNYRFVVSLLYMSAAVANSIMWACASPIQTKLAEAYDVKMIWVNLGVSLIYLIIYIPMTFVSNYIIDEKGLKAGISIGCVLTIIGLWVRTLSLNNFLLMCLGQAIGSFGAPCILNTPQKLSANWYGPGGRSLNTTLLSLAAPIGVGLGFFIPTLIVPEKGDITEIRAKINRLMVLTAIVGTVMCALPILLTKEKPPTPPSAGAAKEKFSYGESIKQLRANNNYLKFLAAAAFFWGTYSCLASVMNPLIAPLGYGTDTAGLYGLLVLASGMIGSIGWGIYVGISKKYKQSLLILSILSTMMLAILLKVGPLGNTLYTGIGITLYGFFTTPTLPIIFEFCCEITFPVAEANAGGITYMMTQAMGIVASLLANVFLKDQSKDGAISAFFFLIVLQSLGVLGVTFVKEDLRRTKYESGATSDASFDKRTNETGLLSNSESYY